MPVFKRYMRSPRLKAKHVMSTPPVTIEVGRSIAEAARLMAERGVGSLIVVDKQGLVKGILTERDIINSLASGKACAEGKVEDIMSRNPIVASPDDDLEIIIEKMRDMNIRHIPVIDEDGRPLGMISVRDIIDLGVSALKLFVE
ncbi:conserved hypothetical protein [Aeropyrum pernix K1]|uniref:CBS domain-containing protein n=1 Tax=Aeropyrum pernix (strain ATCC 700893 / DSM 11879 / JCM 9820 / NBRC 100138 / K1) TaxID=272557 RepID=Q9YFH9_AERPE|nr:CBS domain-containing protein [Aeropyrum pernix]BAA79182.1 conserved hypothetical protein [Aeropyrum pernix K1]